MAEKLSKTDAGTAFNELLVPVLEPAYGAAFHMCRNSHDAEDLVQEAALQAYKHFHQFQPGTKFKAWFFKILTNLFYYKYRKKKREPQLVDLEDAPDCYLYVQTSMIGLHAGNQDPAESIMGKMEVEHVQQAISGLPEEFRVVAALYFIEDFSYEEIAQILGKPVGTVRSRLHRGRKMLQKALWHVAEERGIVAALAEENAP
ncbi:MAG TPA: sigma-70 family RNA polymerase sigma factor [Candidatus Eisenbacteria bacterium]|nr:sigma-70 family RNA polymerase sigma factor [Candidatus Eisenbacteria bacterium]